MNKNKFTQTFSHKGYLSSIEEKRSPGGFDKKIVKLVHEDKQVIYVEFRSNSTKKKIKDIPINSIVVVDVVYEGKVSKKTGLHYNNIVAIDIKKLQ